MSSSAEVNLSNYKIDDASVEQFYNITNFAKNMVLKDQYKYSEGENNYSKFFSEMLMKYVKNSLSEDDVDKLTSFITDYNDIIDGKDNTIENFTLKCWKMSENDQIKDSLLNLITESLISDNSILNKESILSERLYEKYNIRNIFNTLVAFKYFLNDEIDYNSTLNKGSAGNILNEITGSFKINGREYTTYTNSGNGEYYFLGDNVRTDQNAFKEAFFTALGYNNVIDGEILLRVNLIKNIDLTVDKKLTEKDYYLYLKNEKTSSSIQLTDDRLYINTLFKFENESKFIKNDDGKVYLKITDKTETITGNCIWQDGIFKHIDSNGTTVNGSTSLNDVLYIELPTSYKDNEELLYTKYTKIGENLFFKDDLGSITEAYFEYNGNDFKYEINNSENPIPSIYFIKSSKNGVVVIDEDNKSTYICLDTGYSNYLADKENTGNEILFYKLSDEGYFKSYDESDDKSSKPFKHSNIQNINFEKGFKDLETIISLDKDSLKISDNANILKDLKQEILDDLKNNALENKIKEVKKALLEKERIYIKTIGIDNIKEKKLSASAEEMMYIEEHEPVIFMTITDVEKKQQHIILYKELNNICRDEIHSNIIETVLALNNNKIIENMITLFTKRSAYYTYPNELSSQEIRNVKNDILLVRDFDLKALNEPSKTTKLFQYCYTNSFVLRDYDDGKIVKFYMGDNYFSNGYGKLSYEKEEIYDFIKIFDDTEIYFNTVLKNPSFAGEEEYYLFEKLFVISVAIERFISSKLIHLKDIELFDKTDIKNFLVSYGMEGLADILDKGSFENSEEISRKILTSYTDLIQNKGSRKIVEIIQDIFSINRTDLVLHKVLLNRYNNDSLERLKNLKPGDMSVIEITDTGTTQLENPSFSYSIVDGKPVYTLNDKVKVGETDEGILYNDIELGRIADNKIDIYGFFKVSETNEDGSLKTDKDGNTIDSLYRILNFNNINSDSYDYNFIKAEYDSSNTYESISTSNKRFSIEKFTSSDKFWNPENTSEETLNSLGLNTEITKYLSPELKYELSYYYYMLRIMLSFFDCIFENVKPSDTSSDIKDYFKINSSSVFKGSINLKDYLDTFKIAITNFLNITKPFEDQSKRDFKINLNYLEENNIGRFFTITLENDVKKIEINKEAVNNYFRDDQASFTTNKSVALITTVLEALKPFILINHFKVKEEKDITIQELIGIIFESKATLETFLDPCINLLNSLLAFPDMVLAGVDDYKLSDLGWLSARAHNFILDTFVGLFTVKDPIRIIITYFIDEIDEISSKIESATNADLENQDFMIALTNKINSIVEIIKNFYSNNKENYITEYSEKINSFKESIETYRSAIIVWKNDIESKYKEIKKKNEEIRKENEKDNPDQDTIKQIKDTIKQTEAEIKKIRDENIFPYSNEIQKLRKKISLYEAIIDHFNTNSITESEYYADTAKTDEETGKIITAGKLYELNELLDKKDFTSSDGIEKFLNALKGIVSKDDTIDNVIINKSTSLTVPESYSTNYKDFIIDACVELSNILSTPIKFTIVTNKNLEELFLKKILEYFVSYTSTVTDISYIHEYDSYNECVDLREQAIFIKKTKVIDSFYSDEELEIILEDRKSETIEKDTDYGLFDSAGKQIKNWDELGIEIKLDYTEDDVNFGDNPGQKINSYIEEGDEYTLKIPETITKIGAYALTNCSSLTSITVDENNTTYKSVDGNLYSKDGKTLIQYATGKTATSFDIPDAVESIDSYAFSGNSSLTSVTIGNNVNTVGKYVFSDCSSLEYIYCDATNKPSGWDSSWKNACNATVVWSGNTETPQLLAPTISINGDTLQITDTSGLATSFDILVDGVVKGSALAEKKTTYTTEQNASGGTTYIITSNDYSISNGTYTIGGL